MRKYKKIILSLLITLFVILNVTFVDRVLGASETVQNGNESTTTTTTPDGETGTVTHGNETGETITDEELEEIDKKTTWDSQKTNKGYNVKNGNCGDVPGVGDRFSWLELKVHGDWLCDAKGVTLLNEQAIGDYNEFTEGADIDEAKYQAYAAKPRTLTRSVVETVHGTTPADPVRAFICAYATCPSETEFTAAQIAWWGGSAGGLGEAAQEFGKYVNAAVEATQKAREEAKKNGEKIEKKTKDDFGKTIPDGYFDIDYEPKWYLGEGTEEDDSLKNPTVKFDEITKYGNDFVVGDFAIDYIYNKLFAYITNIQIETNDPEHPILKLDRRRWWGF